MSSEAYPCRKECYRQVRPAFRVEGRHWSSAARHRLGPIQREFRAYADERETCDRPRASHGGRRSGDQFCVHIADHYVLPELTREQIEAIRDLRLSSG